MKLTNPEKLILVMLADLHEKLGIDTTNTDLLKQAIFSNNTWALSWEMPGIVGDDREPTPPEVSEVLDILGMWSAIERSYGALDAAGQETVRSASRIKAAPVFRGFDGNNESEYLSIASFLIDKMDRFGEFKGRDLNSHAPGMDGYRRMVEIWKDGARIGSPTLSAARIGELLNAQYPA